MGMTRDSEIAEKYELLTLNADTVFTPTVATYTIDSFRVPYIALVGPVENQAVRCTMHGVDPVVATKLGHLLPVGGAIVVKSSQNIKNLRIIREAAVTAYVPITYFY